MADCALGMWPGSLRWTNSSRSYRAPRGISNLLLPLCCCGENVHTLRDLFSSERPTLALQSLLCATAEHTSVVVRRVSVLSLLLQGELALRLPRNVGRAWVVLCLVIQAYLPNRQVTGSTSFLAPPLRLAGFVRGQK